MDISIGIINSPRELSFESDQSAADVEKAVLDAIDGGAKLIRLVDSKGNVYLVPVSTVAYVEVGSEASRRVGFVA